MKLAGLKVIFRFRTTTEFVLSLSRKRCSPFENRGASPRFTGKRQECAVTEQAFSTRTLHSSVTFARLPVRPRIPIHAARTGDRWQHQPFFINRRRRTGRGGDGNAGRHTSGGISAGGSSWHGIPVYMWLAMRKVAAAEKRVMQMANTVKQQ